MINSIESDLHVYEKTGRQWADSIYPAIEQGKWKGAFILGNGPNLATAMQAALILTESTGLPFQAMSLAQFDHGPKESSPGSFIYIISPEHDHAKRIDVISKQIINAGAMVSVLNIAGEEYLTPIPAVIPFFFYAHFLSQKLGRKYPFQIGGKITEPDF